MTGEWDAAEIATLRIMRADGCSARHIAEVLPHSRSRNAVLGKIHRLKLPHRGQTISTKQRTLPAPRVAAPKTSTTESASPRRGSPWFGSPWFSVPRAVAPKSPVVYDAADPGPMVPPITTIDLRSTHCRWPYDAGADEYHYCGRQPDAERPFCLYHCSRAYQPKLTKAA